MRTIRGLRAEKRLSQEDVAKELDMQTSQYNGLELVQEKLPRLAKMLGVKSIKIVIEE